MERETIGKYTLVSKIADGGMAEVYLAETIGLEGFAKRVALKKILPYFTSDKSFVHSFINEARICGQLHHPNLVEVYGFDLSDDVYYLAMEYIDGLDLERILSHQLERKEPFPVAVACALTLQVLDGLDYAHTATTLDKKPLNLIHRDLKPSNVLIDRSGVIKIVDFGIAKASSNVYKTRDLGTAKGTVGYMSPEQAIGAADLTPASDLFSVGIILYELLTLRRLFEGKNVFAILEAVRSADVEAQLEELSALPEALRKVLRRALARDLADRYSSAQEMIRDLRGASPKGRGHDQLARFVKKLCDQGLTPLHGQAPSPSPTGASQGGSQQRTRLLDLATGDAALLAGADADEATLPLPPQQAAPNPDGERATRMLPLAKKPTESTKKLPERKKKEDTFDSARARRAAVFEPSPRGVAFDADQRAAAYDPEKTREPEDQDPMSTWVPPVFNVDSDDWRSMDASPSDWRDLDGPSGEDTDEALPKPMPRGEVATLITELPQVEEQTGDFVPTKRTNLRADDKGRSDRWSADRAESPTDRGKPAPPSFLARHRGKMLVVLVAAVALGVLIPLYQRFAQREGVFVHVESSPPGAEVLVEGKRVLSTTPGTFFQELEAARSVTIVLRKEGYMDTEPQVFELKPDEPDVSLRFSLTVASGTATLTIDSDPPGASIWVDGEFTRKYTPATVDVEAGSREIVLRRNGYKDFHDEIQVREGAIESIARSLEIL